MSLPICGGETTQDFNDGLTRGAVVLLISGSSLNAQLITG